MIEVKATELELVKEFDGFHLARYEGNLGIWKLYSENIDWDATLKLPQEAGMVYLDTAIEMAYQLDDDCNHLLEPEWEGLFECRVLDIKAEMDVLALEAI
jgi:ubiquinone biosynthesis protein Coq4